MYEPATARFISTDPLPLDANPVLLGTPNLYKYAQNDPVNRVDPSGLYDKDVHFYMTYYLALAAGFGDVRSEYSWYNSTTKKNSDVSYAYMMAWAAQYTDVDKKTQPVQVGTDEALSVRYRYHFRHTQAERYVQPGSETARAPLDQGIKDDDVMLFGIGLHAYEDSWSHAGYDSEHAANAMKRSNVDRPANNVGPAMDMAKKTYEQISIYYEEKTRAKPKLKFQDFQIDLAEMFKQTMTEEEGVRAWQKLIKDRFKSSLIFSDNYPKQWVKDFREAAEKIDNPMTRAPKVLEPDDPRRRPRRT